MFNLIHKDRQLETLVEKLCQRFRSTRTERQARDLAYSLGLFNHNERMIRKLQDNLPAFSDKLYIQEVYDAFTNILNTAKKASKQESKVGQTLS